MKITKTQLRQIIKEEISKELEEGPVGFIKKMMGPRDQDVPAKSQYMVSFSGKGKSEGPYPIDALDDDDAMNQAKEMMRAKKMNSYRLENSKGEPIAS